MAFSGPQMRIFSKIHNQRLLQIAIISKYMQINTGSAKSRKAESPLTRDLRHFITALNLASASSAFAVAVSVSALHRCSKIHIRSSPQQQPHICTIR